jgi:hypothetical protein
MDIKVRGRALLQLCILITRVNEQGHVVIESWRPQIAKSLWKGASTRILVNFWIDEEVKLSGGEWILYSSFIKYVLPLVRSKKE